MDLPVVKQGIIYSQLLAGTILITKVAYEAWLNYVLRENGDPDADPGGLLFRTVQAVAVISAVPWLVRWVYLFGTAVAGDVAKLPGVDYTSAAGPMEDLVNTVIRNATYPLFTALGVLFALVMFIVILIQVFIRAADLAVVAVSGTFMALGLTKQSSELFPTWWKELLSISLAQAIQLYLIKVSFYALTYFNFADLPLLNLFLFCGCLWVTFRSPYTLKQFIYSTGLGRAAGSAAQSAGMMVLFRRLGRF